MTRDEALERRDKLQRQVDELEDQLLSADAQSASISAGGGSKSYTNRSVSDIKAKLAYARRRLAAFDYALGKRATNPNGIQRIEVRFR